jgi:hypothetical protein
MGALLKNLTDPRVLAVILSIIIIIIGLIYFIVKSKPVKAVEGFYPVTQERIDYQNRSRRMYNDYADMIPINKATVIPRGEEGDPYLVRLLQSPQYEGSKDSETNAGLNYNYEFPYLSPPDNTELMKKILKCESVTDWNCEAFNDPEFLKYCGICTTNGENHNGKAHKGGLYIDPYLKDKMTKDAAANKKPVVYIPSAGTCKGEFLIGRPYCDTQKDRDDCSRFY